MNALITLVGRKVPDKMNVGTQNFGLRGKVPLVGTVCSALLVSIIFAAFGPTIFGSYPANIVAESSLTIFFDAPLVFALMNPGLLRLIPPWLVWIVLLIFNVDYLAWITYGSFSSMIFYVVVAALVGVMIGIVFRPIVRGENLEEE
jgi:hypothetical protein